MKKERVLKYLILICAMIASFFVFAREEVSAEEYEVNGGKIVLDLAAVDSTDPTKGYVINGATTTCNDNDYECVVDWEMPSTYGVEEYPIVGIASGDSMSGVLSSLNGVVSGTITLGANMETIGTCAFCNFDKVDEIILNEKLTSIGEYAFAHNDILTNIEVRAYNNGYRTELTSVNAFDASVNISRIIFKNGTIANTYKGSVSGWAEVTIPFRYKVAYIFYDENGSVYDDSIIGYSDEKLQSVAPSIDKTGLNFKWVAKDNELIDVYVGSDVFVSSVSVETGPICEVVPNWSLKNATFSLKAMFNGSVLDSSQGSVTVQYMGKNKVVSVDALVNHELKGQPGFSIDYEWINDIGEDNNPIIATTPGIEVVRVINSGIYICKITLNYDGYNSINQEIPLEIVITKRPLVINVNDITSEYGDFLEAKEGTLSTYYQIVSPTSLVEGESIQKVIFSGYFEKNNVGSYPNVIDDDIFTIARIGYEGDETNYLSDYDITYNKFGKLTVVPRPLEISLDEDINVEYGSEEDLTELLDQTIYGEDKSLVVKYTRKDASNKNADRYDVDDAVIWNNGAEDTNYDVTLLSTSGKVVIYPKTVNVDWKIDENLVYSGAKKEISAIYYDIESTTINLRINVKKIINENEKIDSEVINAGKYLLTAVMETVDGNYSLDNNTYELQILKAKSELIGDGQQYTEYNGQPQKVEVSLNHNEGTVVYGDYSHCVNAHSTFSEYCLITVSAAATENYEAVSKNFRLNISKYEFQINPKQFEFNYGVRVDGCSVNEFFNTKFGERINVCYSPESGPNYFDAGEYDIVGAMVQSNSNYVVVLEENSGLSKIKINPAPIEVKFLFYENLKYDGKVKNIEINYTGTDKDVGLVASYGDKNVIKNAGNYRIDVRVTDTNYYISNQNYIEFSIAKAKYDVSNLSLSDSRVKFDFKHHFINLEGELPSGLTAVYSIDGNYGNGTYLPFKHTVKITFEGDFANYEYVEPMTATLYVDMTWVFVTLIVGLLILGGIPVTVILLVKYNVIKFRKRINRRTIRKLLRRSKELDSLYEMFREKREQAGVKDNDVEEGILAEDVDATFKKNRVNKEPILEGLISMSFVDKLFKSSYGTKQFYSEVKNELLSYQGVVSKIKRDFETFYLKDKPIARFNVIDGALYVYFALDPSSYKVEEYHHETVNKKEKEYSAVPLKLRVDSIESLRHAKMFVRIIRKHEGVKSVSNFIRTDYVSVYTAKEDTLKMFKKAFVKKGTKEYESD